MIDDVMTNPAEDAGQVAPETEAVEAMAEAKEERPPLPPMIVLRKPNRLSMLKNRPRAFQQEVIDFLDGDGGEVKGHCLRDTVEWLKTKGVQTCISSVCEFRIWWEEAHQRGAEALELLGRAGVQVPETGLTRDHILKAGLAFFEEQAVKAQDEKRCSALLRLRLREEALELQRVALQIRAQVAQARLEVQERLADCRERMTNLAIWKAESEEAKARRDEEDQKQAKQKKEKPVDNYAAIEAMRLLAFADVDALHASGKVVIPD
jgi:hypothetical protein